MMVGQEAFMAAALVDRGFVELRGPDARSLLQGLVTNDVGLLTPDRAIFAALLTPQGKYLFDFIMIDLGDAILLDCEATRAAALVQRLMLYRLRAAVEIREVSDAWTMTALFGPACAERLDLLGSPAGTVRKAGSAHLIVDPRTEQLGVRRLRRRSDEEADVGAVPVEASVYHRHRLTLGVPEGAAELPLEKALVLESNFEALNGVSFSKGCFVGQELTARMHYRALIKKRLVPIRLLAEPSPPIGSAVMAGDDEVGELRGIVGDRGLALVRLSAIEAGSLTVAGIPIEVP